MKYVHSYSYALLRQLVLSPSTASAVDVVNRRRRLQALLEPAAAAFAADFLLRLAMDFAWFLERFFSLSLASSSCLSAFNK